MSTATYLREEIERLNQEVITLLARAHQAQRDGNGAALERACVRLTLATGTRAHACRTLDSLEKAMRAFAVTEKR